MQENKNIRCWLLIVVDEHAVSKRNSIRCRYKLQWSTELVQLLNTLLNTCCTVVVSTFIEWRVLVGSMFYSELAHTPTAKSPTTVHAANAEGSIEQKAPSRSSVINNVHPAKCVLDRSTGPYYMRIKKQQPKPQHSLHNDQNIKLY